MIIRQGDILLMKATDAPKDAEEVPREDGRIIVAEGEATGHHHAIRTAGVTMLEKEEVRWLVAPTIQTAHEAVAWTFDMDTDEYKPDVET